jgi:hypothetical protein
MGYEPVLGRRKTRKPIADEFPDSEPWEREQLVMGFCSDECFDKYIGAEGYVYVEGKRYVLTPMGTKRKIYA